MGDQVRGKKESIREIDFMIAGLRTVSEMNQSEHWATRMRRKHSQQEEVMVAWLNNLRGRTVELPCVVKLTRIGSKRLDQDNLASSMKFCQDQIARLLNVNDGDESKVRWEYHQLPIGTREYGLKISIFSQPQNTSPE